MVSEFTAPLRVLAIVWSCVAIVGLIGHIAYTQGYFVPWRSLRLRSAWSEFWSAQNKRNQLHKFYSASRTARSLRNQLSFIWIFPATIFGSDILTTLIISLSTISNFSLLITTQFSPTDIQVIWQVHAAITSIAFVVAVFLVQFSTNQLEELTRSFILHVGAVPLLYFIASTSLVLLIIFLNSGDSVNAYAVVFSSLQLILTIAGIVVVYVTILRDILKSEVDTLLEQAGANALQETISFEQRQDSSIEYLSDYLNIASYERASSYLLRRSRERLTTDDIEIDGFVSDLNLKRLSRVVQLLNDEGIPLQNISVPIKLDEDTSSSAAAILSVNIEDEHEVNLSEAVNTKKLEKAVRTRSKPPMPSGIESFRNIMQRIERRGFNAINQQDFQTFSNTQYTYRNIILSGIDSHRNYVEHLRFNFDMQRIFRQSLTVSHPEYSSQVSHIVTTIIVGCYRHGNLALYDYFFQILRSLYVEVETSEDVVDNVKRISKERSRMRIKRIGESCIQNAIRAIVREDPTLVFSSEKIDSNLGDFIDIGLNHTTRLLIEAGDRSDFEYYQEMWRLIESIVDMPIHGEAKSSAQRHVNTNLFFASARLFNQQIDSAVILNDIKSNQLDRTFNSYSTIRTAFMAAYNREQGLDWHQQTLRDESAGEVLAGAQMTAGPNAQWLIQFYCLLCMDDFMQPGSTPAIPIDDRIDQRLIDKLEDEISRIKDSRPLSGIFSRVYADLDAAADEFLSFHEEWLESIQVEQYQNYLRTELDNSAVNELKPKYEQEFVDKLSMRKILRDQEVLVQDSKHSPPRRMEWVYRNFEKYHFANVDYPYIPIAHPPIVSLARHHAHRVGSQWLRAMDPHLSSTPSSAERRSTKKFISRVQKLSRVEAIIVGKVDTLSEIREDDRYERLTTVEATARGYLDDVPIYQVHGDFEGMIITDTSKFQITEPNYQSSVIEMQPLTDVEFDSLYNLSKVYIRFLYFYTVHIEGIIGEIYHSR